MPNTPARTPSLDQLQRAVAIARQIESLQTELNSLLGTQSNRASGSAVQTRGVRSSASSAPAGGRKRRKMSAEARAKISAAASARWAKIRGAAGGGKSGKGKAAAKKSTSKKRTMSAETRAKIAEASKRRWAEKKKAAGG